jgi:hypothetical protein
MRGDVMGRAIAVGAAALLVSAASLASAQQTVPGTFALSGAEPTVTGQLVATETGPLAATLELTFSDKASGDRIESFVEELTQELHLLAIDSTLSTLVHEHVKAASPDGTFTAQMQFPRPGTYHVYADTVPEGHGQQVLRFDIEIGEGEGGAGGEALNRFKVGEPISIASAPYEVRLDASALHADQESALMIEVLEDGQPAADLQPYLGVAAHAVLIRAEDLAYVHAHPTTGHGAVDDMAAAMDHSAHGDHAAPAADSAPAHDHGHAANADATVSPHMVLHLTPPGAGDYTLFLEFIGGDEVHTIPVALELP